MNTQNEHLNTLQDIKQMMERSSRFISLSGLSGIAAGCCALVGAWFGYGALIEGNTAISSSDVTIPGPHERTALLYGSVDIKLLFIAAVTFIAALSSSFLFTWLRSRKTGTPLWSSITQRIMISVLIPIVAGGIYLLKMVDLREYGMIAPGCLIFYGLALLNASKYTLQEIRYLGLCEIVLGILNLWYVGKGLYFWAAGFGLLHIIYGVLMWWRYERKTAVN